MSATVSKWKCYVGDTDTIQIQLNGIDAILAGATVTAHVIKAGVASVDIPAAATDLAERVVTLTLTTWLATAAPGTYKVRVILNNSTWPESGEAEIEVVASHRPVVVP